MIGNTAFLAALTVLVIAGWLAGEVSFLAPYRTAIFSQYGPTIGTAALLLFFNLCAAYYVIARWLFVRETGRKLTHVDRQLTTPDAVLDDLRSHLTS